MAGEQAHLIVERGAAWRDSLRRYAIEVDGMHRGAVRANAAAHLTLFPGISRVRVAIDGFGSPHLPVFLGEGATVVVRCAAGDGPAAGLFGGGGHRSYLRLWVVDPESMCRAYLRHAWRIATFQMREKMPPGPLGPLGISRGDIGVLYRGCREAGAGMVTRPGSANHRLWEQLTALGWLRPGDPIPSPPDRRAPVATRANSDLLQYIVTEPGRYELLEILA